MLMDIHLSMQVSNIQSYDLNKERFKPTFPVKSEVDEGANRCQHILVQQLVALFASFTAYLLWHVSAICCICKVAAMGLKTFEQKNRSISP